MGIHSITQRDDGTESIPSTRQDWRDWVSASKTRNHFIDDPILDWLDLYGAERGYPRDDELAGYDERFDFMRFILAKGKQFESAACDWLTDRHDLIRIGTDWADTQDVHVARRTWEELKGGREIVAQGVLWNPQTRTYGSPDLLVRSDVLRSLFPEIVTEDEAHEPAPDLDASWHYRAIDIKYTTLKLLKDGHASTKHAAYMAQVFIYNEALGRLQGFTPPAAYLLGRAWQMTSDRGDSALEQLARVDRGFKFRGNGYLSERVDDALSWIRRLRTVGDGWMRDPDNPEVVPDLSNRQDGPWHTAKQQIATELGMDEVRTPVTDPLVQPTHVTATEENWREPASAEFFVDFETVNDLDDDFSAFPRKGAPPILFMIGCGHFEDDADPTSWAWRVFIADGLDEESERGVIEDWLTHMAEICGARDCFMADARLYHWAQHEPSFLCGSYNACTVRHGCPEWADLPWLDLLKDVFKAEPVVVGGTSGNGLKETASAMHDAGLIGTKWGDGPADGLGAQAGAWWSAAEARRRGCTLANLELMQSIAGYNEIDCKVMAEILCYLRENR